MSAHEAGYRLGYAAFPVILLAIAAFIGLAHGQEAPAAEIRRLAGCDRGDPARAQRAGHAVDEEAGGRVTHWRDAMSALRFRHSLAGIALFVAFALVLIFGTAAAFRGQSLSWATNLSGWLFAALLVVAVLHWAVIWLESRRKEG